MSTVNVSGENSTVVSASSEGSLWPVKRIGGEASTVQSVSSDALVKAYPHLFPFAPNWDKGVIETFEWKTDVLRAFDGTEQRRDLRVIPRRGLEYDFMVRNEDARLFDSLMWRWQNRNFAMPVWTDIGKLTSAAAVSDLTIALNTDDLGFADGGLIVLYRDTTTYEVTVAETVASGSITLRYPIENAWSAGTRVYPALVGRIPTKVPTQRYTDRLSTGKVIFACSPDVNATALPVASASVTHDGKEVMQFKPNWRSSIDNEFEHLYELIDAQIGPISWATTEETTRITRPMNLLVKNRQVMTEFRAFIARLRGRSQTVWIPSWHDDITVAGTTANGSATLIIAGTDFHRYVGLDTSRDRLAIRMTAGETFYRKINGLSVVGGDTILQLDAHFGREITPADVKRVHLLLHCRLAGDKVEIPWRTNTVADPQLVFTTVPI